MSSSPAATFRLGERIGEGLQPGSILALIGDLGCGKTLLTKGICAGLGVPERQVNSPTFVLVNEYSGRLPVFHMDLYRLGDVVDEIEIGVWDYLSRAEEGVMVVEWAEKMLPLLPDDYCQVRFTVLSARKRQIVFTGSGTRFEKLLEEIGDSARTRH